MEDLQLQADADTKLDKTDLDNYSVKLPSVQNKWHKIFREEALILKKLNNERACIYKERWIYYSGKAEAEIYQREPLDIKILRNELDIFLNSDTKLIEIDSKIEIQKQKMIFVENTIKTLNTINWNIRNTIEYMKFTNGSS